MSLRDSLSATARLRRPINAVAVLALLFLSTGCALAQTATPALAEVDGYLITTDEVAKSVGAPLARLEGQLYALKQHSITTIIDERLLAQAAAERGMTVQALLDAEVTAKVEPVTGPEEDAAYATYKTQLQGDEASIRQRLRPLLADRKLEARRQAFLASLRAKAKIVVNLPAPPTFHPEVSAKDGPYKGRIDASVTIVEFQDFHCPFCRQVQPVLAQIVERYGDRVKLVYRDFPIDQLHPQARKAHEAARCAKDQGKFWPYHDVLYASPTKADPDDLLAYAKEAKLDVDAFQKCVVARVHRSDVQRDIDDGIRAGVTGTPTFFIDDQQISGAQSFATFASLIDQELAKTH